MCHSEKNLQYHAISETILFWDLILKTNLKRIEKKLKETNLRHRMYESSRKTTSSCYLGNVWLLRLVYEDKNCKEKKIEKTKLHHMMHKSSRRSYIIRLSRKSFAFETWLWRQKMSRIKKVEKINLHHKMYESSRKSYIIMLSRKLSTFEKRLWN